MDCLCDNKLDSIIISGEFTDEELQKGWINIYSEFIDLSDSADKKAMFNLVQNILLLKIKIIKVTWMVKYLTVQMEDNYVEQLKTMNFRYEYDRNKPDQYSRDLKMILTRIKGWRIDLFILEDEYKSYEDKNSGETPSRSYFNKSLVRLGKWMKGGVIQPQNISTAIFCEIKNEYHEYIEDIKQTNAKRRQT